VPRGPARRVIASRGGNALKTRTILYRVAVAALGSLASLSPAWAQPEQPAKQEPPPDAPKDQPPPADAPKDPQQQPGPPDGQPTPPDGPADAPKDPPKEQPPATTGVVTGVIEAAELGVPVSGATVTVVAAGVRVTSDVEGRYRLELPPGTHTVRVEVVGFQQLDRTVTVTAGGTAELNLSLAPEQIGNEVVVVVGARTPRSNLETTAPVDIVTSQEIARSGRTETGRMLNALVPSYVSTPQTIADGSDHIDPASLRGLGPDQVLVLVNGKRRHKTALMHVNGTFGRGTVGTDLNAIPSGSIKRIEVLRDGAASQYGSDAIAGVINIVTKDITDLVELTAQTGVTGSGDGAQLKTSANYGFKLGSKGGFMNLTGEFLRREPTSRSGTYTGPIFSMDPETDASILNEAGLTRDDFKMKIGESAATVGMGAYNMELPLDEKTKLYSFGDVSYRRGLAAGFYRFPFQVTQNVPEFYPVGFLPHIATNISDAAISVGMRHKGPWQVDASLTHGRNAMTFFVEDSVNASLGTSSPTTFNAGTLQFAQTVGNLDLVHKLDTSAFKSLSLVLGSEFRIENYQIVAGDEASYVLGPEVIQRPPPMTPQPKAAGAQVFPGFQPANEVDRTRDSIGVYAGIESEPTKGLTVDVGGRFEQYSDFGNSLIGKAAGRLAIVRGVALRGAVSTGFRAPSLQQLWFSNISTQFIPDPVTGELQPNQVLTSNNASPVTRAFGIPELDEEKSINASGGLTLRPIEGLSVTTDAYFIRLKDRIVLTSQFATTNTIVADILAPFPGVSQAQFFANAVDTNTMGLDVVIDYTFDLQEAGKLALTGSANFTKTEVTDVKLPTSLAQRFEGNSDQLRTFFFGRLAQNRLEDAVPHQKGSLSARYTLSKLTAQARGSYFGKVYFKQDNPDNDEVFGAKVLVDAEVGYQLTKNLMLAVGGNNIFNTFPDKLKKDANTSFGRFIYSRGVSQIDQNGAFYYARAEVTFF
jgi:iron complex outermembrane recepter protein